MSFRICSNTTDVRKWLMSGYFLEKEIKELQRISESMNGIDLKTFSNTIEHTRCKLDKRKSEILKAIQAVDDPLIRLVMEMKYLQNLTAEQIQIKAFVSCRNVYRLLDKGDKLVVEYMKEREICEEEKEKEN